MRLTTVLLCDFASQRGNLLTVVGGGINQIRRPSYPSALGVMLAVAGELADEDFGHEHRVHVVARAPDGTRVAVLEVVFAAGLKAADASVEGLKSVVPLVIPLGPVIIPAEGLYSLHVSADRGRATILTFWAQEVPQGAQAHGGGAG